MTLEWEAVEKDVKDTNTAPEQKILATMTEETGACASINPSKTDELIGLMTEMMKLMKEDKERTTVSSRYQPRGRGGYGRGQRGGNQKDLQCWAYGLCRKPSCVLDMWETEAHKQILQPRSDCEFIVDTDASDFGIGAVLSQIQNEKEVVIAYSSRTLSKSERNYCTTRKELLALVFFIKQYRHYLYGKKFRARTDHKALKWLFSMKEPEGQTARWITQLSEYEFSIEHREGKRHRNADGMSRIPCHQCGNDENITSAVNRQFCYVQNDTSRRQQELVIKNDTSAGSGTACCSSRITDTSSTLRDQSSNDSFQKAQQEQDKDIYMVLSWDIGNRRPEFRDVEGKSPVVKDLWSKFDQLVLHNEMLYIRWENARKEEYKLKMVVPRKLVNEILYNLHTSPLGGHLGVGQRLSQNHTAPVIAEILIDQFISRFGAPFQLHSDQGPEFESRLISELCKLLGIDKTRTTTYHPQSDGQVERFNRTLLSMLSKYVKENQRDWDVHLQKVMMGYRTSEHESTKFSPAYVLFGRELRLPLDVQYQLPDGSTAKNASEYVTRTKERFLQAYEVVRENLGLSKNNERSL
ncbi:unnamed protein product [Mytilus edulis]|uniref:Integrase catalytic domain-containing protein n=1 Tax=Mytilus edulis TaxID=6550 RepID=A0A8S3VJA5_MYTED|nr:unnamed protein product [Mytilus edulis]